MNREDFLYFENNPNIIYFDNAATSLKPKVVVDKITEYYNKNSYNINRGIYKGANLISKEVNDAKKIVKEFLNAKNIDNIYFTSGATESSKILSEIFKNILNSNDEILLSKKDHISTIKPFIDKFSNIKEILIDKDIDYDEEDLYKKLNKNTKLVILTYIHNLYGYDMGLNYIIPKIRELTDAYIIVDASQAVGHLNVDVEKLDVDALYFSGHKMFSETGIGVLYMNDRLNNLSTYDFSLGTPHISGILSLKEAINYINNIGIEKIEEQVRNLTLYLKEKLEQIEEVDAHMGIMGISCRLGYGIISFKIKNHDEREVASVLSDYNIYVRSDNQCNYDNENYIRVSLHFYNTKEEIDRFINILTNIVKERV